MRHGEIRRLALTIRAGRHALASNRAQLQTIVDEIAPGLTQRRGIGAVTAAQAIVSFSHPGRCRNDAAFAALSGTSPLPASSGQTVRHRLNRGGDRALNCAIHTIALSRTRSCADHQGICRPSQSRGQVNRDIRRCLMRDIARQLYRAVSASTTLPAQTPGQIDEPLDKHRSVSRSHQRGSPPNRGRCRYVSELQVSRPLLAALPADM